MLSFQPGSFANTHTGVLYWAALFCVLPRVRSHYFNLQRFCCCSMCLLYVRAYRHTEVRGRCEGVDLLCYVCYVCPRDWTQVTYVAARALTHWAISLTLISCYPWVCYLTSVNPVDTFLVNPEPWTVSPSHWATTSVPEVLFGFRDSTSRASNLGSFCFQFLNMIMQSHLDWHLQFFPCFGLKSLWQQGAGTWGIRFHYLKSIVLKIA